MMEGIEFQLRSPQNETFQREDILRPSLTYPLPMDKKLAQGDAFRISKEKLALQLNEIEGAYSPSEVQSHTGSVDCPKCTEKKAKIAQAFSEYYLSIEPGTWSLDFPGIRQALQTALDSAEVDAAEVHRIFQKGLREHLKNDLCTPHPSDVTTATPLKQTATKMFDDDMPLSTILSFYVSELDARAPNPEAALLMTMLQSTRTAEERAALYVQYYCSPRPEDTPTRRNFKQKYARVFESLVPYDEVVSAMRREADEYHRDEIEKNKNRIIELQMAQNAHLKVKQKKEERGIREKEKAREQVVECSLEGCTKEVNLATDGVIECAICDWLAQKGGLEPERRDRAVYCSVEHAQEGFELHDQQAHSCVMGERCVNYPAVGPSESSGSGICNNCCFNGYISYFCSSDCHYHNFELHRDEFTQREIGIHNDDDRLDVFRPAADFEMLEFEDVEERENEREMEQAREREHNYDDDDELEEGERMDDA